MKRVFKKIIPYSCAALLLTAVSTSCTDNYEEINTDKNAVMSIGAAEMPYLFSKAISAVRWNDQVGDVFHGDQYAQYLANISPSWSSDRLIIDMGFAASPWNAQYTEIVPQLQTIFEKTDPNSAEYAIANIWWVYTFHRHTDYWGPIPYFKAGIPGKSVAYDPQDKIYDDFFKRLAAATNVLKTKTSEKPFGSFDLIYGGDAAKWLKFANTLRLRLAIRISDVDPARAKTEGEAAFSGGVFTSSPDDDALAKKNNLDGNSLSAQSDYNEARMSAAMESVLKGYEDPRISVYFLPALNTNTYEGVRNGLKTAEVSLPMNVAKAASHVGPRWSSPASGGIASYLSTPANVMSTAEAYLLRAEGAMLGWNMGGTPKELYEGGIINSMKQWGITDQAAINAYVSSTKTPVAPQDMFNSPALTHVPVKFDPSNAAVQREQIAVQKWLALFPDGREAWASYRRTHKIFDLYPITTSDNPDIPDPSSKWIRRLPFLTAEYQSNGDETRKAVSLLNGQDKIITPLWWDKN
ncbi:SusD/RagB family nutrient-binding outer membrane lipoprotein [Dyadobacter sp. CY323]|uniref:SusD/RagB family nutrient-binding outer membrane lipoprotein n=1 Tax=Dyadobacter sp. CY323 TaxID=2907302 RepID=UPI001F278685|nr:SusD/RagB family nutrient-binding outer membrane lipoprotein [Dyadobacter sp. CY323]MCE6988091.1 SusD/RagB family nutrient-binding outer membrane lipoprotein [Dyadobacter sp. CY323]